jgi:hypothetical protein
MAKRNITPISADFTPISTDEAALTEKILKRINLDRDAHTLLKAFKNKQRINYLIKHRFMSRTADGFFRLLSDGKYYLSQGRALSRRSQ